MGQTGQLFTRSIAQNLRDIRLEVLVRQGQADKLGKELPKEVTVSSNLKSSLRNKPDVIILATPNPVDEILESISSDLKNPVTLILPQNGVDVIPAALRAMKKSKVSLVRASLYTTINLDKNGKAEYNEKKKRITLAEVKVKSPQPPLSRGGLDVLSPLNKSLVLFEGAGFDVRVIEDYRSMEWTKLIANLLGSTGTVTGLSPKETFLDKDLFLLEFTALRERLEIIYSAGIKFAEIPWQKISILPRARYIDGKFLKVFRKQISEMIASGRNNQPPAAARKISENRPTEAKYYHRPFVELGLLHGLRSIADESIFEIISEHEDKRIDLNNMTQPEMKELLFKTCSTHLQKPLIPRNPIITYIVGKITDFFCKNLTVKSPENLDAIRESLNSGKSVILLANHSSHADHPLIVKMLRENGFKDLADRIVFIAGMKVKNEFLGRRFNDAYSHILVSTPTRDQVSDEENRKAQLVNLKGFSEINRLLNKGNLIVLYAEGTRSRDKKLLKAIPSVARYFENPNIKYLIPLGIQGANEILPIGSTIPRIAEAKITVGEPVQPSMLFSEAVKYLPDEYKSSNIRDKDVRTLINELAIDLIMKKIASLLPKEQRGFYA